MYFTWCSLAKRNNNIYRKILAHYFLVVKKKTVFLVKQPPPTVMASQLMHSNTFQAKPLQKFNIRTNTIMMYPPIIPLMSPAEKAHAFNTNKNALENLQLSHKNMLRSLEDTHNCSVQYPNLCSG